MGGGEVENNQDNLEQLLSESIRPKAPVKGCFYQLFRLFPRQGKSLPRSLGGATQGGASTPCEPPPQGRMLGSLGELAPPFRVNFRLNRRYRHLVDTLIAKGLAVWSQMPFGLVDDIDCRAERKYLDENPVAESQMPFG